MAKVILAVLKSVHYVFIWFMVLIGINIFANYLLNTEIALEQNVEYTYLFILLIFLEVLFRIIKTYVEILFWERENDVVLEYKDDR